VLLPTTILLIACFNIFAAVGDNTNNSKKGRNIYIPIWFTLTQVKLIEMSFFAAVGVFTNSYFIYRLF
jgi:hypothetical protein